MNPQLRHFLIYGFRPALKPGSEAIFICTRYVDFTLSTIGLLGLFITIFTGNSEKYWVFLLGWSAVCLLIQASRLYRGHTYRQLNRKDVKSGRKEAGSILRSAGVTNGKK